MSSEIVKGESVICLEAFRSDVKSDMDGIYTTKSECGWSERVRRNITLREN